MISIKQCFKYLLDRGLTYKTIKEYSVECEEDKPVFPIFLDGKIVAKSIRIGDNPKYKTVRVEDIDEVPPFGLQLLNPNHLAVLVEGQIDAMILHQIGYNSVASLGFSRLKIALKYIHNKRVVIFPDYDGDITTTRIIMIQNAVQKFLKDKTIYIIDVNSLALTYNIEEKFDVNDLYLKFGDNIIHEAIKRYAMKVKPIKRKKPRNKQSNMSALQIEHEIEELWDSYNRFNRGYLVVCPYHPDSKPSLAIYEDTGTFYCFGCGKHGTVEELFKYKRSINKMKGIEDG